MPDHHDVVARIRRPDEIEKSQQQKTADAYKVTVHMDSGAYQTVTQGNNAGLRVGDRVRIDNGSVSRY